MLVILPKITIYVSVMQCMYFIYLWLGTYKCENCEYVRYIYNNREKMTAISIYLHATDAEKARKWREFTLKGTISIPMP